MKLVVIALLLASSVAAAEDRLRLGTDVVKFDKALTESQCLDKVKAALGSLGMKKLVPTDHTLSATETDYIATVDCLQSYGFNGAHVSVAALSEKSEKAVSIKATLVKSLSAN